MGDRRRYWAFLSYSHTDRAWADWLHCGLETYAVPGRLVGRATRMGPAPRRFQPVFRDRAELTADADLRARVREALEQSAFLIVICSPDAARSPWVEEEIVRFKTLHGEARVLAIIVAGAPRASASPGREAQECFPPALRVRVDAGGALTDERADPIAADVRPGGDGRRLAMLKLLARMLDVGLDELVQRDAQRRQGRLAALAGVSMAGAVAMGGLAAFAFASRNEARAQRSQAEGLVEFMLGDLRKKLEPEGRLDVLDSVGARAMTYYTAQAHHGMDPDSLGRRARVLHLLGDIRDQAGDLSGALKDFQEAAASTAKLLKAQPKNTQRLYEHAQSIFYIGYIAYRRGDADRAAACFEQYKSLAEKLRQLEPGNYAWKAEVADADANLGTVLLDKGQAASAVLAFSRALEIEQALAARTPHDRDRQMELAKVYAWRADAEAARDDLAAAIRDRFSERHIYTDVLAGGRQDKAAAEASVVNATAVGNILIRQNQPVAAMAELRRATYQSDRLIGGEPDDTTYRQQDVVALEALSQACLDAGLMDKANAAASRARSLVEALAHKDPSVAAWSGAMLGEARLLQIRIAARRATTRAARREALAPAVAESERLGRLVGNRANLPLARSAAEASILAGDYDALAGQRDSARRTWENAVRILERAGFAEQTRSSDRGHFLLLKARMRVRQTGNSASVRRVDSSTRVHAVALGNATLDDTI